MQLLKSEQIIFRSHLIVFNRNVADVKIAKNPLLLLVRIKMGLEVVVLPWGISHRNAGSGTSCCSHCHENIRHKWSPLLFTCLSGSQCNGREAAFAGNWVMQKSTRGSIHGLRRLLCALSVGQIIYYLPFSE